MTTLKDLYKNAKENFKLHEFAQRFLEEAGVDYPLAECPSKGLVCRPETPHRLGWTSPLSICFNTDKDGNFKISYEIETGYFADHSKIPKRTLDMEIRGIARSNKIQMGLLSEWPRFNGLKLQTTVSSSSYATIANAVGSIDALVNAYNKNTKTD